MPGRRSCRCVVANKILRIIDAMLRALADPGLLEQALRRHFERCGPSPPAAAA